MVLSNPCFCVSFSIISREMASVSRGNQRHAWMLPDPIRASFPPGVFLHGIPTRALSELDIQLLSLHHLLSSHRYIPHVVRTSLETLHSFTDILVVSWQEAVAFLEGSMTFPIMTTVSVMADLPSCRKQVFCIFFPWPDLLHMLIFSPRL